MRETVARPDRSLPRVHELDWLMLAVVSLCCIGLTMAVSVSGLREGATATMAMREQGSKLLAGLVMFVVCSMIPLAVLQRFSRPLYGFGVVLVLMTFFGSGSKGAKRWIEVGGSSAQPVEFARLALIVLTATTIAQVANRRHEFRGGFVPILAPAVLLAGLLALQPDLGNALLTITLVVAMGLASGVPLRWFTCAAVPVIPLLAYAVLARGYAVGRVASFLSDEPPYQVQQSLIAISSGGITGAGVGNGWMKMGFVPEAHNDFVFAVIGEELGLIGGFLVLGLFSLIGFVGFRLVLKMRDPFCRYLVFGCTLAICLQALVNLLVTTGMAPAKGIDLPLVSSGGTNLVAMLGAVGLIGNAARTDCAVNH